MTNPLYIITLMVAFCSIVYELLMAQTLTLLTGDSVLRYSTTIGLYLASMGVGAFLCSGKRLTRSVTTLLKVEILLSIVGGTGVVFLHLSHALYSYLLIAGHPPLVRLALFFTVSYGIIAIIGVLTGFELPLLMHIREQEKEKTASVVLGVDYLGSLAGAILFPLILLPRLGVLNIGFFIAILNILVALTLLFYKGVDNKRSFVHFLTANISIGFGLIILVSFSSDVSQYCLKKYYYYLKSGTKIHMLFSSMKMFPEVEQYRSPYQNIDIVKNANSDIFYHVFSAYSRKYIEDPDYPKDYWLFLNGDYQFFSGCDELYHEYMVHVPIIANKVPRRVLVLGGGDGLVNRELLKYKDIESIIHVELDPAMINVAKTHPIMRRVNDDSLRDPRVSIRFMDAFYFVKTSKEQFDAIFIDFPNPIDYNLSKLYSREFYSFMRNRLTSDGFVAIDAPWSLTLNDWLIYYNTIKASGFQTIIPFTSVMEEDNPSLKTYHMRRKEIKDIVHALYQGFIMMRKGDDAINMNYKENDIKLYVLNEKRYKLAFSVPYPKPVDIDWDKVNSIMRPKFPNFSPVLIRLPY